MRARNHAFAGPGAAGLGLLIACALGVGPACKLQDASATSGPCSRPLGRLPSDDLVVMSVGRDEPAPQALPVRCQNVTCLHVEEGRVAVIEGTDRIWASWEGQPGRYLERGAPRDGEELSPEERWAHSVASVTRATKSSPRPSNRPQLPPELRTCGTSTAGGGLGYHIIRNDGDVWQRIHWVRVPTDELVEQLPKEAYPLTRSDGTLCGYAVQKEERDWVVHPLLVPDGEPPPPSTASTLPPVELEEDHEHPPADCVKGGLRLLTDEGTILLSPDGRRTPAPERHRRRKVVKNSAALSIDGRAVVRDPGPISVTLPGGERYTHPHGEGKTLAGDALPADTRRTRLLAAGDGERTMLLAERLVRPDCTSTEALHRLRVDTGEVTTVAEGDLVFSRLSYARGRFYWVQAPPRVIDLGGGL